MELSLSGADFFSSSLVKFYKDRGAGYFLIFSLERCGTRVRAVVLGVEDSSGCPGGAREAALFWILFLPDTTNWKKTSQSSADT